MKLFRQLTIFFAVSLFFIFLGQIALSQNNKQDNWLFFSPSQMLDDDFFANVRPPSEGWHQATVEEREGTVFGEVFQLSAELSENEFWLRSRNFSEGLAEEAGNPGGLNGITVVYRVKGVEDFTPEEGPHYWPEMRFLYTNGGNVGIRPFVENPDSTGFVIVNSENYNTSETRFLYPLDDSEWITVRAVLFNQQLTLYVNEEEDPIIENEPITDEGNAFRFNLGDVADWANFVGEVEWVAWNLGGGYSPAQLNLPDLLQGVDVPVVWHYFSPTEMMVDDNFVNVHPDNHQPTIIPRDETAFGEVWQLAAPTIENVFHLRSRIFNELNASAAGNIDAEKGVTLAYRVKGVEDFDYSPESGPFFWPELRVQYPGGGQVAIRPDINHPDSTGIVLDNSEEFTHQNPIPFKLHNDQFVTFRLLLKDREVTLYLNEDEEPIVENAWLEHSGGNFRLLIGENAQWANMVGEVEWVAFSMSGALSPEEAPLPEILQNDVPTFITEPFRMQEWARFFPNPVRDRIHIKAENNIEKIEIFDITGKKVYQASFNQPEVMLPVQFNPGMYIIRISDGNRMQSAKIHVVR